MAIQDITTELNIIPGGIIPVVHVSQYDVGRVLAFPLIDGNSAASLPSGTAATVEGTKPSNKGFSYSATISDNVVTVNTTQQMTIEEGTVYCKLKLTKDTQVIGTAMFIMEVERAGINDSTDISETDIPAYIEGGRQNMLNSEAWAVGTKGGTAVESTEPQYHNNSKYYSDQAGTDATTASTAATTATTAATLSESWAVGNTNTRTGENTNNSKYWCQLGMAALQEISAMVAVMRLILGTIYLTTEGGDNLITEGGDMLIMDY